MPHPDHHIFEHSPETLKSWCDARGWPAFRARQILEWVYRKGVADPARMTNLRPAERERLAAEMTFLSGEIITQQDATDGTRKLLIQWADNQEPASASLAVMQRPGAAVNDSSRQTECVMIPAAEGAEDYGERRTACISSQIGCPVGCRFCASGLGGLDGNLSAGRIVEQVWRLARLEGVGRITNIVFMGMGEPLANLAAVTAAVRTLAAPWGMGVSARKITISTVGLHQAIERLADEMDLPVTLALSLHAPNDTLRRKLIPWAQYTTIDQLIAACTKWFEKTGREITLEYTLLGGVNDQPEHARELVGVARRLRANINLIRYNEVVGLPFRRPRDEDVRGFQELLRGERVNTHIRRSRGRDIAAACGQLRHETTAATSNPTNSGKPST